MAARLKDIPKLASNGSNLQAFAEAVREVLQTFRGYRGDPLDQALTLRFARDGGLVGLPGVGGGGGTIIIGGGGGGGGGTYTPDLTPPPTPTGLAVTAGISHIYVAHDTPVYTVGNGHDRTVVYGAKWPTGDPAPTFMDAVELFTFQGNFGAYPSDPNTRWCIWIKWRTMDQVESTDPAGGTNGAQVTTGQDVTLLLEALTGEITESQLYAALGARINLIDAGAGTAGSVNARIASEAATRTSSDSALATSISLTSANVGVNAAAIAAETAARVALDGSVQALYTVRAEVTAGGRTVVGGFGLAATSTASGGPQIDFGVRADRFWIGAPSSQTGVTDVLPFVVQATDQTINGVLIPKGVYMNAAYINNLTAMIARLGNAWIDNLMVANVSASKLTAGALQVGANIQSTVFTPGSAGWIIRANGSAEFASASIRGTLTAGQLEAGIFQSDNVHTRGLTVRDGSGNIILAAGTPLTQANADGTLRNDFLATGINLIYNSAFEAGLEGWTVAVQQYTATSGINLSNTWRLAPPTAPWTSVLYIDQLQANNYGDPTLRYEIWSAEIPVSAGARYILSAYVFAYWCEGGVYIRQFEEDGTTLANGTVITDTDTGTADIKSLDKLVRLSTVFTPAATCAYIRVAIRKYDGNPAAAATRLFVTRLQFEQVAANVTQPSAWSDGSRQHQITAGNASTYIANAAIGTAQISTLNASVITAGTITTDRLIVGAATSGDRSVASSALLYSGPGISSLGPVYVDGDTFTTDNAASRVFGAVSGRVFVGIDSLSLRIARPAFTLQLVRTSDSAVMDESGIFGGDTFLISSTGTVTALGCSASLAFGSVAVGTYKLRLKVSMQLVDIAGTNMANLTLLTYNGEISYVENKV